MSTQGAAAQQGRVRRAVGWARKAPGKRVGGPVAAAAVAISGAFGGLAPVGATLQYPDAKPGQTLETGPFEVSLEKARAIDDLKPMTSPSAGNRYLVLIFKVRNTTDEPVQSRLLRSKITVETEGAEMVPAKSWTAVSTKDITEIEEFQPDITYDVGVLVETVGDDVATEATVGIPGHTWREDSFTPGFFDWRDSTKIAEVTVPVKNVPSAPEDAS